MTDRIKMDTLVSESGITDCSGRGDDHSEKCICCNRGMTEKQVEKAVYMHMTTGCEFVPMASEVADSQGCFQVGSTCASRIRKALKARDLNPKLWIGKVA